MDLKLKNKTALVLSSSKGIGFGIAKALAKENCNVIITSSNKRNHNLASKKIFAETGKKVLSYTLNLKNLNSTNKSIDKIIKKNKKIDILIINGPGPIPVEIEKLNIKSLKESLDTNLISSILITKKIIPMMKKNKFGRIINLASITAKEPSPGMVLSSIARAGIIAFSKTASKEIAKYGITNNSILIGGVMTDRTINLLKNEAKIVKKNYNSVLKQAEKNIPIGFISSPEQFSHFITFLSSPLSIYINGASIPVDGGLLKSI
jgi:3-oxoacyl-[acyl-carrier protein] reductase